ncbi:GAF domain-containing protein [Pseudoduganella danionis]|uniref:histidine kinase n=1 Tax=Pseudoduganella danionis TaxID=1890295 RepID=A0ABW9SSC0_9BURK|nr:GAF domain-containing protein [Pseudoduganella danionis]MTW34474.1 GAF domain-containing protein [Pseudoduganella danionis]
MSTAHGQGRDSVSAQLMAQREADLAIINSVQTALTARLQLADICTIVGDKIQQIFQAQVVNIALLERDTQQFHVPYYIERELREAPHTIGIFGFRKHVLESRQALLFNENLAQQSVAYGNPVLRGETAKSAAFIPMISGDEVTGVVTLQHLDLEFAFSEADVTLLKTITNILSTALENARLFEETQKLLQLTAARASDLEVIGRIGREFTACLDMQAVFHSLALNVHQLLKTNTFFVLLMNSTTQKLDMVFGMENGAALAPFSLALDDPLAMSSRCARTRLEVVRHMRPGEPRYLAGNCPNLSNLYSPLIVGERLLGVMSVQTMESNAYGEREQSIFRTLCSYLTIALDNAAALQAQHEAEAQRAATLEQANATLEQLGAIGREITGNLEQAAVLSSLDRHVRALLDTHSYRIYRLRQGGSKLSLVLGIDNDQRVDSNGELLDIEPAAALCIAEQQEVLDAQAGTSAIYAPLMAGERVLGVMSIHTPRAHAYGERDVAIFRTLCAYGAIALANSDTLAALRRAQAMIIQQEKMASLGQLVANVAHEINTPIGAIKASGHNIAEALEQTLSNLPRLFQLLAEPEQQLFIAMLQHTRNSSGILNTREERALTNQVMDMLEQAGVTEARRKAALLVELRAHAYAANYVGLLRHPHADFILDTAASMASIVSSASNINTAVERVAKIVFALKSYSRVDSSGELREVDLCHSLDTVLTIYQNQTKQGIEVVRNYHPIAPLRCLPDELNQVWTNLIYNAIQAMQNQGTLTINIEQVGNEAVVAIRDTGCGIPPEIRDRIFDAFFTTKPAGEGSGLGLDIVRKIVDKHHGRITVDSEAGVGTEFAVHLPLQ